MRLFKEVPNHSALEELRGSQDPVIEDKDRLLQEEMNSAQLRFADRVWQKSGGEMTFSQALEETSSVLNSLEINLRKAGRGKRMVKAIVKDMERDIDRIRVDHPEDWRQFVQDRINESYAGIFNDVIPSSPKLPDFKAGPFSGDKIKAQGLENQGISPKDELLDINLDSLFVNPEISVSSATLRKYFGEMARYLQSQPNIKAVVGESWLLAHPIGRAIGFITVPEKHIHSKGLGEWSQFVTKEGVFNKMLFEKALEDGTLPFRNVFGYIPTEDFLRRYLRPSKNLGVAEQ